MRVTNSLFQPSRFSSTGWTNIALITLAIFYLTQFGLDLMVWRGMCGNLGGDYCAYWSAGRVATKYGYSQVYNLDRLDEFQRPFAPKNFPFEIRPVAYLPVFLIPFQFLSSIPIAAGFWLWTSINLAVTALYLRFFIRQTTGQPLKAQILSGLLLSLPMFTNLFFGQVNIWLTICIGEHLRAILANKPFKAGMWLGGLLIKPHYLVLVTVVLMIRKFGKVLAGLLSISIIICGLSFWMAGAQGLVNLLELWLGYTSGLPTADPYLMMNWRMVALNLQSTLGATLAWSLAIAGTIASLFITFQLWRQPIPTNNASRYSNALLGTLAATTAVAWHSHIFSGTILLAPLAYVANQDNHISRRLFFGWVLLPAAAQFFTVIIAILIRNAQYIPEHTGDLLNLLNAGGQVWMNISILLWAASQKYD